MFKDFVLDLETMGTNPRDAIMSIGIAPVDTKTRTIGEGFYTRISLESCQKLGMNLDASTVLWWMQQEEAARQEFKGN